MKFSAILLALLSSSVAHRAAAADVARAPCCLCDNCDSPAEDKIDMILLGLPNDQTKTCLELANHLEIVAPPTEDNNSVQCQALREKYSKACCTESYLEDQEEEDEIVHGDEEQSYYMRRAVRNLYQIWSSSWSATRVSTTTNGHSGGGNAYKYGNSDQQQESSISVKCKDHPYTSNSVKFATPGGACECPVCKSGAAPQGWYGGSLFVPGRGQHSGSCTELNEKGMCRAVQQCLLVLFNWERLELLQ